MEPAIIRQASFSLIERPLIPEQILAAVLSQAVLDAQNAHVSADGHPLGPWPDS